MALVWEAIQGLGSLVGLVTGLFIVWDRYNRSPSAVAVTRPIVPGGGKGLYLDVRNGADRPILVSWQSGRFPGKFSISEGHEMRHIVASTLDGHCTVILEAGETRSLLLLKPQDVGEIDPDNRIEADLLWRYAQPIIWQRERRMKVAIPKRSLMVMAPDQYGGRVED